MSKKQKITFNTIKKPVSADNVGRILDADGVVIFDEWSNIPKLAALAINHAADIERDTVKRVAGELEATLPQYSAWARERLQEFIEQLKQQSMNPRATD